MQQKLHDQDDKLKATKDNKPKATKLKRFLFSLIQS